MGEVFNFSEMGARWTADLKEMFERLDAEQSPEELAARLVRETELWMRVYHGLAH